MTESSDTLARELPHSIELDLNAAGKYIWKIKLYFERGEELEVLDNFRDIDKRLREAFLPKPQNLEKALEDSLQKELK